MTLRNTWRAISAAFLLILGSVPSRAHASIVDGLVGYYDFETDLSNKAPGITAFNAAAIGSVTPGWTGVGSPTRSTLIAGNALNIVDNATASNFIRVDYGSGNSVTMLGANLAGDFSISAWHYLAPASIETNERFYVFEPTVGFDISWGTRDTSSTSYLAYNSETSLPAGYASLSMNAWHNVVHTFTLSGANVLLNVYVDGVQFGATLSRPVSSMDFTAINFGNARNGQDRVWDGMLDEIAIWDRPLSAGEVATVYQTGLAGQSLLNPVPEPSTLTLGASLLVGLGFWKVRKPRQQQ